MRRISLLFTTAMVATTLVGCDRPAAAGGGASDEAIAELGKKLDKLDKKLDKIEEKVGKAGKADKGGKNRRPRPDAKTVYSVPVEGSPFRGAENAKITVVKAFEYACPFCKRARPTMDTLLKDYEGDLKVVYKNYVVHPASATDAALASCAAGIQGKFTEMEELIWTKGFDAGRNLKRDNMEKLGKEAGLDMAKFKADMDGDCKGKVKNDRAALSAVGVTGTPAFFINGRFLSGARPVDQFKTIVDEEIKKADAAIAKGTKLEDYYAEAIVKKGKKKL